MSNADFQSIATQFVNHYYTTFDTDRKNLEGLYRDNSMLTFQDDPQMGAKNIGVKLTNLPFQKVVHKIGKLDAQPTANGGIVILVTGQLVVDDGENPLGYTQAFHLCQDANGAWFVHNDIFSLVVF